MKIIFDLSLTSSSSSSSSPSFAFTLFKVFNFDHFDIIMQKEYCNEYECELVYSYWNFYTVVTLWKVWQQIIKRYELYY